MESRTFNLESAKMEEVLAHIVTESNLKCAFIGERSGDRSISSYLLQGLDEKKIFAMTTGKYPKMCRVHPIIDWKYSDVWQFLLDYKCKYCELYDKGYTSIGTMDDTVPNPSLLIEPKGTYLPAYMLIDESKERDGRHKKPVPSL